MAVPKQRHTKSRRDKRRAHIFIKPFNLVRCSHCGAMIPPHIVCPYCGYYKGKQVVDVLAKLSKKERKKKEKEMQAQKEATKKSQPLTMGELSKK